MKMEPIILALVAAGSWAWSLVVVYKWHWRWKFLARKPFNCTSCITGWLAVLFYLVFAEKIEITGIILVFPLGVALGTVLGLTAIKNGL